QTLRTHIKLKKGTERVGTGKYLLRINVIGPGGYSNFLTLNEIEEGGFLEQMKVDRCEELRGMPVLAVYNSKTLVGLRKREIPEY
ncbi:MAG: hypothetical protein PHF67_04530, partial [Candidatus Nanoarchaeia archaeon]|nr:hypothetical protein [Candidatus Nanoarchaeia archaeon]